MGSDNHDITSGRQAAKVIDEQCSVKLWIHFFPFYSCNGTDHIDHVKIYLFKTIYFYLRQGNLE